MQNRRETVWCVVCVWIRGNSMSRASPLCVVPLSCCVERTLLLLRQAQATHSVRMASGPIDSLATRPLPPMLPNQGRRPPQQPRLAACLSPRACNALARTRPLIRGHRAQQPPSVRKRASTPGQRLAATGQPLRLPRPKPRKPIDSIDHPAPHATEGVRCSPRLSAGRAPATTERPPPRANNKRNEGRVVTVCAAVRWARPRPTAIKEGGRAQLRSRSSSNLGSFSPAHTARHENRGERESATSYCTGPSVRRWMAPGFTVPSNGTGGPAGARPGFGGGHCRQIRGVQESCLAAAAAAAPASRNGSSGKQLGEEQSRGAQGGKGGPGARFGVQIRPRGTQNPNPLAPAWVGWRWPLVLPSHSSSNPPLRPSPLAIPSSSWTRGRFGCPIRPIPGSSAPSLAHNHTLETTGSAGAALDGVWAAEWITAERSTQTAAGAAGREEAIASHRTAAARTHRHQRPA